MTQLRSVNYICLVYKFKFLFLGNIYHRSIALLFGTVFFSSFWRLLKLIFWQKLFQNLIFVFSFYPKSSRTGSRKTSITQELLVIESCPTPCWVPFFAIFCRLVYDISSHLNDPILAQRALLQVRYQNSKVSRRKVSHQNLKLFHENFSNFWNRQ